MELLDRKVETKLTEYVTVLYFQKNFMALSVALFFMMISWLFILFTALQGINTKESPGLYYGLYMVFAMTYGVIYKLGFPTGKRDGRWAKNNLLHF